MRGSFAALLLVAQLTAPRVSAATETATNGGPTGLLHVPSAISVPAGTVRGAFFVDGFSANSFLCTRAHPCGSETSDRLRHTGAAATLGVGIVDGLDAYVVTRGWVNESSELEQLLEVLGETTVGVRFVHPLGKRLSLGGTLDAIAGGGPGGLGFSLAGASYRARVLSTLHLDPVRVHAALSYAFDNSAVLIEDVESARGRSISRVEAYGLGIQRVDRVELALGAEWLALASVHPFAELGAAAPVNRQRWDCEDATCGGFTSWPSRVSVGARLLPLVRDADAFAIIAGLDVGLGGTRRLDARLQPQAPWTLWLGCSLTLGPTPPKAPVTEAPTPVIQQLVTIRGRVHVAGASTPVVHASVKYAGDVRPPLSSNEKGEFLDEVRPGSYELEIQAPGYKPGVCGGIAVAGSGAPLLELDCPLEPEPAPEPPP